MHPIRTRYRGIAVAMLAVALGAQSQLPGIPRDFKPSRQEAGNAGPASLLPVAGLTGIHPSLAWRMGERFGLDRNGDRIPDLPNTIDYVHNVPAGHCAATADNCASLVPEFEVRFDASRSLVFARPPAGGATKAAYKWRIANRDGSLRSESTSATPYLDVKLPEGMYDVTLTVYAAEDVTSAGVPVNAFAERSLSKRIPIEDILIVSIGDSLSSGEGNPERVRGEATPTGPYPWGPQWADDGSGNPSSLVNQRHRIAHRSTLAWPAQAAMAIENADTHTSVTFISVATTGAAIDRGLLAPGDGAEREPVPPGGLPAQLDELAQLVGKRRIDLLTLSIGANDAGFRNVMTAFLYGNEPGLVDELILDNFGGRATYVRAAPIDQRTAVIHAARNGDWSNVFDPSATDFACPACIGIDKLRDAYTRLGTALRDRFPDQISNVWALSYPHPGTKRNGAGFDKCQKILDDMMTSGRGLLGSTMDFVMPDAEIGGKEQSSLVDEILIPLNNAIRDGAVRNGWNLIALYNDFFGHGYCAPAPNLRPGEAYWFGLGNPFPDPVPASAWDVSWFRTAMHSAWLQGPLPACPRDINFRRCVKLAQHTHGTMHPNELGHQAIKARLLASVVLPVEVPGVGMHDTNDQLGEAANYLAPVNDAIIPRTDVDVYKLDPSALPLIPSKLPAGATAPSGPQLVVNVTSDGSLGLRPLVRLYDRNGVVLHEQIAAAAGAGVRIARTLDAGNSDPLYVAVSDAVNNSYDIHTGWDDKGGAVGLYKLSVQKVVFMPLVTTRPGP